MIVYLERQRLRLLKFFDLLDVCFSTWCSPFLSTGTYLSFFSWIIDCSPNNRNEEILKFRLIFSRTMLRMNNGKMWMILPRNDVLNIFGPILPKIFSGSLMQSFSIPKDAVVNVVDSFTLRSLHFCPLKKNKRGSTSVLTNSPRSLRLVNSFSITSFTTKGSLMMSVGRSEEYNPQTLFFFFLTRCVEIFHRFQHAFLFED